MACATHASVVNILAMPCLLIHASCAHLNANCHTLCYSFASASGVAPLLLKLPVSNSVSASVCAPGDVVIRVCSVGTRGRETVVCPCGFFHLSAICRRSTAISSWPRYSTCVWVWRDVRVGEGWGGVVCGGKGGGGRFEGGVTTHVRVTVVYTWERVEAAGCHCNKLPGLICLPDLPAVSLTL